MSKRLVFPALLGGRPSIREHRQVPIGSLSTFGNFSRNVNECLPGNGVEFAQK